MIDRKARSADARWSVRACRSGRLHFMPDGATLLTGGADACDPALECGRRAIPSARRSAARPAIHWRPMPAITARKCFAPASPVTRFRRRMARARARRWRDCSAARSPRCPAIVSRTALKKMNIVWTPETVAKTVRGRPERLYARHQDAGAAHRLAGRPQGAHRFSGTRDGEDSDPLLRSRSRK